jgi:glyoxylase-like metal-dependent hydrolase (beta-lactamase superfamily II)
LPRRSDYGPNDKIEFALGELKTIRNVSVDIVGSNGNPRKGNAFLVVGSLGSLLMDTGFAVDPISTKNTRAVFLSHFHGDHTSGLWQFVEQSNAPIILSEATLTYLCQKEGLANPLVKKLIRNAHIIEEPRLPLKVDGDIRFFRPIMPLAHTEWCTAIFKVRRYFIPVIFVYAMASWINTMIAKFHS